MIHETMFKRKLTKWMPLGNFNFDGTDFIVFVRGNLKNGMMDFKVVSVNRQMGNCNHPILPRTLLDVQKQWDTMVILLSGGAF